MSAPSKRHPRSPEFLSGVRKQEVRALFADADNVVTPLFREAEEGDDDALGVESLAPPLPAPPPAMTPEAAERLGRAVAALQAVGERAASELAATALELAVLLARKILDAELRADPALARKLIQGAVRRLGDAHKVTVRLAPQDVDAVKVGAGESLAADFGVARVELVADTNLTSGDCIVESDAATVDGRLGTRVEELRRVLETVIHEEAVTS